jgi:hypothetical protein
MAKPQFLISLPGVHLAHAAVRQRNTRNAGPISTKRKLADQALDHLPQMGKADEAGKTVFTHQFSAHFSGLS